MEQYWNHNAAYHPWILKHIQPTDKILDVGCGDGLLLQKLAFKGCQAMICTLFTGQSSKEGYFYALLTRIQNKMY